MAFELSANAQLLSQGTNIEQQLILEIDGISTIFGAAPVLKVARYGDAIYFGDAGLLYGGNVEHPDQEDWISLAKTSKTITQQLRQDKGASSSVTSMKIELIDKNDALTALFQPGATITDILSAKAKVYLNFAQGAHPDDSIQIFSGIVDDIEFAAGTVLLNISHPEQLKRISVLPKVEGLLNGAITDSDTTLTLDSTANIVAPSGKLKTYVQIEDEIIQVGGVTTTTLTGCTRGQLGTSAAAHVDNTETATFYRLEGEAIQLALELMLSGSGSYASNLDITSFVQISATETVSNAIKIPIDDLQVRYGITLGDLVTVSGATNGANNFTDRAITAIQELDSGYYIVVDGAALVTELSTSAVLSFKSQYDLLPFGAAMTPAEVDVAQHQDIQNLYGSQFHSYDFYIKDTIDDLKKYIEEEVYFASGLYSLPRKGRSSVGVTNPPLATANTKVINLDNVINPASIGIRRSINKNFYNSIVYKYDQNSTDDKFLSGVITLSADSTNRINVGNKPLTIKSTGIRTSAGPTALINTQSRKFLDRYKYGAESITLDVMYGTGFAIEVGDVVIFEGEDLKVSDMSNGTRTFEPRLMEVTNKSYSIVDGKIRLELTDTAFELDGRYGTVSPSSIVASGSSTTLIQLQSSYGFSGRERDKWEQYVGTSIKVHSEDFATSGSTTISSIDSVTGGLNVSPALGFTPSAGYIVDVEDYDSAEALLKKVHCFFTPSVSVVSGSSGTVFDVGAGDVAKLFVGSIVRLHNADFTDYSDEKTVTNISTNTITVADDLGFTPSSSHTVELIGFSDDSGEPYRLI